MPPVKKPEAKTSVRLLCIYSDGGSSPGPGQVVELEAQEAERLISIKAAEYVKK
jgi:hypothetical protein